MESSKGEMSEREGMDEGEEGWMDEDEKRWMDGGDDGEKRVT